MKKINQFIIISFMGVDGSGKTTISKKIKNLYIKSKYLHLKPYILFKDHRTVIKNPHKLKKSTSIISFLRLLSWLISYKVFFLISKNAKIYIFDRYAHDILIDPHRYKHNLSENITKIVLSFFPKPDLWIFLKPSLKTIKLRKSELPDNELRRQTKKYIIFFKKKKNVLIINKHTKIKKLTSIILKKIKSLA